MIDHGSTTHGGLSDAHGSPGCRAARGRALVDAIKASIADGLPYAIAAGNESQSACTRSPARVKSAMTVGGTDKSDRQWNRSNFGPCPDLYAPAC